MRSAWGYGRCRDNASRATDGLPAAADAPLQHGEMAKSARTGHSANTSVVEQAIQLEKGDRGPGECGEDHNHLDEPMSLDFDNAPLRSFLEGRGARQCAAYAPIT